MNDIHPLIRDARNALREKMAQSRTVFVKTLPNGGYTLFLVHPSKDFQFVTEDITVLVYQHQTGAIDEDRPTLGIHGHRLLTDMIAGLSRALFANDPNGHLTIEWL